MTIREKQGENQKNSSIFSNEFEHWEHRTDFLQHLTDIQKKEQSSSAVPDDRWKTKLLKTLRDLSPKDFETFCLLLTQKMGIQTHPTLSSSINPNKGIDRLGFIIDSSNFRTNRIAITIKRLHADVTSAEIQRFQEAIAKSPADYGIFLATANFSSKAKHLAVMSNPPVTMIDGATICDLVAKYDLHVKEVIHTELNDNKKE